MINIENYMTYLPIFKELLYYHILVELENSIIVLIIYLNKISIGILYNSGRQWRPRGQIRPSDKFYPQTM